MIAHIFSFMYFFISFQHYHTPPPTGFTLSFGKLEEGREIGSQKRGKLVLAFWVNPCMRTITLGIKKGICETAFLSSFLPSSLYISTTNFLISGSSRLGSAPSSESRSSMHGVPFSEFNPSPRWTKIKRLQ